ncbi:MAG: RNA-binding cell elongation regulator Jag/EloR [Anaerolineaceae bacterium]
MSLENTTLEIIAPSVEEATEKGLRELGLPAEAVIVDVLDSGSKGLFGLGGRQARVRLTVLGVKPAAAAKPAVEKPAEKPRPKPAALDENEDLALKAARETVQDLLEKMKVKALVSASYLPDEDAGEERQIMVNIEGDDLSILIGRRSETLNALQYISSLIVGKELEHWVPLQIDVQGYRSRRERQLKQLAHRMAEQAVHTGKRQVLEPMSASERRIIHVELSNDEQVFTESVGEEPNRKVTISPKK